MTLWVPDVISGKGENDRMCGGRGADLIYGSSRRGFYSSCAGDYDVASGGKGDDRIYGGGSTFYAQLGSGNDYIDGCNFKGIRVISYTTSPGPVAVDLDNLNATGQGRDALHHMNFAVGSNFDDTLKGTEPKCCGEDGANELRGGFGDDSLKGLGGPDVLHGGDGDDDVLGQDSVEGKDTIIGSNGDDYCTFDTGDEVLECET